MTTRRERALERDKAAYESAYWSFGRADSAMVAYEAELAADLQSDETVRRAVEAYIHELTLADAVRAALKAAVNDDH